MGCIYSDFHGKCTMFDENIDNPGVDEEGNCLCEDDPDPSVLCEMYESDGFDDEDEEE